MGRERRSFTRPSGFRDATLFVIASEGARTEPKYFRGVREQLHSSRLHIEVLERQDRSNSSPVRILRMLDSFAKDYKLRDGDQLWLVMDRDRQSWRPQAIAEVARECVRKGYHLAVSNPCFEVWLLLHFEDIIQQAHARKSYLLANSDHCLKTEVASRLDREKPYIENFFSLTEQAIERAKRLDTKPRTRWPHGLGTRVYRLLERLLANA